MIVVLDEPKGLIQYGGQVAAPVFREIAARVLRYLRVGSEADADRPHHREAWRRRAGHETPGRPQGRPRPVLRTPSDMEEILGHRLFVEGRPARAPSSPP